MFAHVCILLEVYIDAFCLLPDIPCNIKCYYLSFAAVGRIFEGYMVFAFHVVKKLFVVFGYVIRIAKALDLSKTEKA